MGRAVEHEFALVMKEYDLFKHPASKYKHPQIRVQASPCQAVGAVNTCVNLVVCFNVRHHSLKFRTLSKQNLIAESVKIEGIQRRGRRYKFSVGNDGTNQTFDRWSTQGTNEVQRDSESQLLGR